MKALAVLLLLVMTGSANATFFTGNRLYELCESSPLVVGGYVMGVTDFMGVNLSVIENGKQFICVPPDVTGHQATDVVCKYLSEHPKDRNLPASILVHNVLLDAWPCAQK